MKRIGITWLALLGLCLCVRTGFLHAEEGALDDVSSEDGSSLDSSISDGAATTVVEEEPPPSVPRLTLQDCIERALANRRGEWTAQIDVQKGQVLQATTSYVPRIQVEELVGPLPEDGDLSTMGVLNRVKITAGIPVYDFGRARSYRSAAEGKLFAEERGVATKEFQEVVEVTQLYYGYLLARETYQNLLDAQSKVSEFQKSFSSRKKNRKGFSRADELQMEYEILKLESQMADARMKKELAEKALTVKLGFSSPSQFVVSDRVLRPIRHELLSLEDYHKLALENRPEISALERGVAARQSFLKAEQKALWPAAFLGGFFENGYSTTRENDQDFNYTKGGLGLALNWSFDVNNTRGKVLAARSEYYKLLEQQRLALPAIELDVTRAFLETQRTKEDIERGERSRKIGRALLLFAKSNWDLGLGDPLKLKDALIRFNEARFQHAKSVVDYNLAVAKLSQAVGAKSLPTNP